MLQVNELSKKMYGNPLFEGASFKINTGEKVALAGSNGTGKSTMLKLIILIKLLKEIYLNITESLMISLKCLLVKQDLFLKLLDITI